MSFEMPKFDMSNPGVSKEEYAEKSKPKFNSPEPGRHTLKVKTSKATGMCKGDESWVNVELELENASGQTMKHWLQVPTNNVLYGAKGTTFVFESLCGFMACLGVDLNLDNCKKVLADYFYSPDPSKLEGMSLEADVGYDGIHAKYVGPQEYILCKKDGSAIENEDGKPLQFADRDAALAYADGNKGAKDRVVKGVSLLKVHRKETATESFTGWK